MANQPARGSRGPSRPAAALLWLPPPRAAALPRLPSPRAAALPRLSPPHVAALPRLLAVLAFALVCVFALLGGCSNHGEQAPPAAAKPADLRILAGSELKELEPDIKKAARAVGLQVELSYSGTLDMVDRINAGEP